MDGWTRATAAALASALALFQPLMGIASAASAGGTPSQVSSTAPQGNADFDPRTLPALPAVPGTGDLVPTLRGVVLDGSSTLSTSLSPRLTTPSPSAGQQVTYEVRSFANTLLWSGTTTAGYAQIPRGRVRDGGSYLWTYAVDGQRSGQQLIEVDVQRLNAQRVTTYGGVGLTSVTGEVVLSLGTVAVDSLPGTVGVGLTYQPSNAKSVDPTPGLPAGWRMESGAGWNRLQRYTPSRFELSDSRGRTITFTRTPAGIWVPRFGPGRTWPAGSWVSMAEGAGGRDVSVSDRTGTVTTFPMPTAETPTVRATSSWSASEPGLTRAYDNAGRLMSVTDPVSSRSVTLIYAGTGQCPALPAGSGFTAVPRGMLCAVSAWDGQRAEIAYSGTNAAPRIARVTAQAQAAPQLIGQTDLGYDAVGRLATMRSPQTNRAIAAGVLNGFGPANAAAGPLLTTVTFDARGRVTRIQRPAAILSGSTAPVPVRGERRFEYPAEGTLRTMVPGRERPAWIHVAAPETMLESKSIDSAGRVTTQSWDTARQVVTEVRMPGGSIKRFSYDALGSVRTVVGPTTTPDSPQAPRMTYAYDTRPVCPVAAAEAGRTARENTAAVGARCTRSGKRKVARRTAPTRPITSHARGSARQVAITGPVSEPMKGLQVTYWGNPTFASTPAGHSTGPVANAAVPATLRFSWAQSPVGVPRWSGRMQGFLFPPSTGTYVFRTGNAARLVVGDEACQPSCTLDLRATRPVPIRVDVVSAASGAASLDITWSGPAGTGPVPTSVIRPGYPMPTRVATLDDLGAGLRDLESLYVFDEAIPSQVVESVSPSGSVQVRQYERYNPAAGTFGRSTRAQLAPGRALDVSYYGGTEAATGPEACRDRGIATGDYVQGGQGRSTSLSGGFSTSAVRDAAGRMVGQQTSLDGSSMTTACNGFDAAGNLVRTVAPGETPDGDNEVRYTLSAGGNPLVVTSESRTGAVTRTGKVIVDLIGRQVSTTDGWGTVTVTSYDALDRAVYKKSTTARGEATETRVDFTDDGQIRSVTVDGQRLAVAEHSAATGDLIGATYANGARFSKSISANLDPTERRFTVGGATLRETFRTAPSGRVLDRVLSAPGVNASWRYRYDLDSRLVGATLAGSVLPDGVTAGEFAYSFDAQSRRTRVVAPARDAVFAYDDATGRMTSTSDPRFPGAFEYDAMGRATAVGPLRLTYATGGQVQSTSDTSTGVSVTNVLDGAVVIGQDITGPGGQGGSIRYSAQGLMLRADGSVASRIVPLPGGVSVQRFVGGGSTWRYSDGKGNIAWEGTDGAAPATTAIFDPDGSRLGRAPAPSLDPGRPDLGWAGAAGMVTAPLSVATIQMGARTYVPALATFLQPDPVPGAAPTPYAYVPDPINAADASGAMPEWVSTAIKVAVATVVSGVIIAKTAGTGALAAKVVFKNIVAGAFAGATGEATAQGAAMGIDWAIDGGIEEHNEWDTGAVVIAAGAGAGAEAGGAALAWWGSRARSGISKAVDDAFDEAFSGLSATDDLMSGAGLNIQKVEKASDAQVFVQENVEQLQQLGVENQVIFKNVHDGKLANEVAEEFSLEYPADMIQVNGQWLNYADLEDLNQGFTMFKK